MNHGKKGRTFNRPKAQREALIRSLARSLVLEDAITTTVAKAKELRPFVESLITEAKKNSVASRRTLASRLRSPEGVKKLHESIAPRFLTRAGGYTRITNLGKIGKRVAEMARIEFVS